MRQLSLESTGGKRTASKPTLLVEPQLLQQQQQQPPTTMTLREDFTGGASSCSPQQGSSCASDLHDSHIYVIDNHPRRSGKQLSIDSMTTTTTASASASAASAISEARQSRGDRDHEETTRRRHKKMRNNKLTSLLVILFGLSLGFSTFVTLSVAITNDQRQFSVSNETVTAPSNIPTTTASNISSESTTPEVGTTTTTTEETGQPEEVEGDTATRLGSLIVDTTSDAVDKILIERRRAAEVAEAPSESAEDDASSSSSGDGDSGANEEETTLNASSESSAQASPLVTNSTKEHDDEAELKSALEVYKRWRSTGDDIIELFSRKVLPVIMENGYDLDPVSMANLLQIFNAIRELKPWSLKLLDAWAKLSPGLLVGTQSDFGDFDECLNVRADNPSGLNEEDVGRGEIDPITGLKSTTIVGKYCIADVEFPKPPRKRLAQRNEQLQTDFEPIELRRPLLNFNETVDFKDTIFVETANFFNMLYVDPIRVGICLTNKIDPDGFANIFNKLIKDFSVSIDFKGRCVTKYDKIAWSTQQVVSAYVLIGACSLVLLSTLLDLLHMKLNKLPLPSKFDTCKLNLRSSMLKYQPLFTSFSIIRNTKRLFKQQQQLQYHSSRQQQQQHYLNMHCNNSYHNSVITAELTRSMALCSTSTSAGGASSHESSSLESSPSIERKSSLASSAINLISESQQTKQQHQLTNCFVDVNKKEKLGRNENNLQCLHGIRVITMTWMIVNHTYLFGGFFVLWAHRRLIDIAEWPKSLSFQLVLNGWLTVETYFFLSAAIIVLNVMPLMKNRKFAYFSYILHRLIRLMPAYIGLICLNFLWPLISSGPVWLVKGRRFIQTPCENYLWTNFLFINNWIWPEKQCMVHTWFLSADFQLYLVAPIIVYLLYRRPVLGHSLNVIVAILASILSGFVIYANKLMPTVLINKLEFDSIKQQLSYSYFATYQHMGPYCLGIFIGYLLYKRPQVNLPKHLTWSLWILLPPLSFTTLLLTYLWNGAYDDPNLINPSPIVSAFYVAIHRTIWTSLLAWIVFACATGRAKIMSSFLSNPIFVPLSRLSFSIYLVHLPVIMFRALNLRHTIEWTDSNILWEACGNFVVSLIFGYFLNIFFESPIINLERVVFGRAAVANNNNFHGNCGRSKNGETLTVGSFVPKSSDFDSTTEGSSNESDHQSSPREERKLSQSIQTKWVADRENSNMVANRGEKQQGVTDRLNSISANLEHQMESLVTTKGISSLETESEKQHVNIPNVAQQQQQQLAIPTASTISRQRLKNYSLRTYGEDPLDNKDFSDNDDLYPASGISLPAGRFHQHNRPYSAINRVQLRESLSYTPRPMQYATLARTSKPNQDEWPRVTQSLDDDYSSAYFGGKSQSHLGEPTDHRPLYMTTGNLSRQHLAYSSQRQRHGPTTSQRPARYNTLTSAGSTWQNSSRYLPESSTSSGADWLRPGALLPRIDSSTLRRQQKLAPREATSSIVEESNSLDSHEH